MADRFCTDIVRKLVWIDRVVGYVWIVLSVLMVVSGWLLYRENGLSFELYLIIGTIGATWTYPLYTLGFRLVPGLIGNILYTGFVLYVTITIFPVSPVASYLLYPVILWVSIATVYVTCQISESRVR